MTTPNVRSRLLVLILLQTGLLVPCALEAQRLPIRTVVLSVGGRVLEVATTEVTQAQYRSVTGLSPSLVQGDELPVDSVSWYEAVAFCNQLSAAEGLDPVYGVGEAERDRSGWRLPTEQEWVTLAEPGSPADSSSAWYINSSGQHTHPVGRLAPNALGLFDLFGNVWEWCDSERPGDLKADHGGGYRSSSALLTVSARGLQGPGSWGDDLGFRIVRTIKPAPSFKG